MCVFVRCVRVRVPGVCVCKMCLCVWVGVQDVCACARVQICVRARCACEDRRNSQPHAAEIGHTQGVL
jgi:hypothetical protein